MSYGGTSRNRFPNPDADIGAGRHALVVLSAVALWERRLKRTTSSAPALRSYGGQVEKFLLRRECLPVCGPSSSDFEVASRKSSTMGSEFSQVATVIGQAEREGHSIFQLHEISTDIIVGRFIGRHGSSIALPVEEGSYGCIIPFGSRVGWVGHLLGSLLTDDGF